MKSWHSKAGHASSTLSWLSRVPCSRIWEASEHLFNSKKKSDTPFQVWLHAWLHPALSTTNTTCIAEVHWVQPHPPDCALKTSGAAALTLLADGRLTLTEHRSHALCCCCNGQFCTPEQMQQCLTGARRELGSGLSASVVGILLRDWAASASIGLRVLRQGLLEGRERANWTFILFRVLSFSWFMQEDYAGYDFENRLHVRIHSAFASMRAEAQPWHFIRTSERTGKATTILGANVCFVLNLFIFIFLFWANASF